MMMNNRDEPGDSKTRLLAKESKLVATTSPEDNSSGKDKNVWEEDLLHSDDELRAGRMAYVEEFNRKVVRDHAERVKAGLDGISTYAKVAAVIDPASASGIKWTDFTDDEELRELYQAHSVESTLDRIRKRGLRGGEKSIIIPKDLKQSFKMLWERLDAACRITGMTLVEDSRQTVLLSYGDVFSENPAEADAALTALNASKKPNEQKAIMSLATLMSLLDRMPSKEDLEGKVGKEAITLVISVIAGITAEQTEQVPLAQSQRWWKIQSDVRSNLTEQISYAVGGLNSATTIVNAVTILYRALFRRALTEEGNARMLPLRNYALKVMRNMAVNGQTLFVRTLRPETRTVRKREAIPERKGQFKIVERVVKGLVRPNIPTETLTSGETVVAAKINRALAKVEVDFPEISSNNFTRLTKWEASIKSWVEELYAKTNILSRIASKRKNAIRATILTAPEPQAPRAQGGAPKVTVRQGGIKPEEWTLARDSYLNEHREQCETEFFGGLSLMLDLRARTWGEILELRESDFLVAFRNIFRHV
jgi:hypothetical protein